MSFRKPPSKSGPKRPGAGGGARPGGRGGSRPAGRGGPGRGKPRERGPREDFRTPAAAASADAIAAIPVPAGPTTRLFIATKNPGKARELAELLAGLPFRVVGPEVIAQFGSPVEDGITFEANARKKALHFSQHPAVDPETLVIADDSGLEIDALDGQPGVRSARLGGPSASDTDRVHLVLNRLEGVPWDKRTARFKCVIAIGQKHKGVLATFEGVAEGRIAFQPAGAEGFGYDPIFYYPAAEMTFAEMAAGEKNRVSHRGQALERAVGWLREWAEQNGPTEPSHD